MVEHCPQEGAVLKAFREGRVSDGLASHARECQWCADSLSIAQAISETDAEMEITVPPQGLVYWKAKLRDRREQRERALAPARRMESLAAGLVLATPVLVLSLAGMTLAAVAAGGLALTAAATVLLLRQRLG